jgi:hypothetical protein
MARNTLPIHPSKRHPLTGEPLRALWVRPDGRICWPVMGGAEDDGADAGSDGAGAGSDGSGADGASGSSASFPANTPVAEMKPEEQAAYWQDKARKHEGRVKALGGLTAEELATLREKAERQDALEAEMASEKDKAVNEAKTAAQAEVEAKYRPMLAETAFRVAIGDRKPQNEVDDFIADLNLTRFLNEDGQVDTAKVLARVEQFAPAKGTQQQRGPVVTGHGARSGAGSTASTLTGRELYEQRHKKSSTSTNS